MCAHTMGISSCVGPSRRDAQLRSSRLMHHFGYSCDRSCLHGSGDRRIVSDIPKVKCTPAHDYNAHNSAQQSGPLATSSVPLAFLPYSSIADDSAMRSLDKALSKVTFAKTIDEKLQTIYTEWLKSKSVASIEYVALCC